MADSTQPTAPGVEPSVPPPLPPAPTPNELGDEGPQMRDVQDFAASLKRPGGDESGVVISRTYITHNYGAADESRPRGEAAAGGGQTLAGVVALSVAETEVEETRATFLPPVEMPAARKILREAGFVILCGPAGAGKRAAAIQLSAELNNGGQARALFELTADKRLVDLQLEALRRRAGLFVETPSGVVLEELSHTKMKALHDALRDRDATLIVCCEQLSAVLESEHRHYLVRWQPTWSDEPLAARRSLLFRHLAYVVREQSAPTGEATTAETLAALLEKPELTRLLEYPLKMSEIVELAHSLLPVLSGQRTLEEVLSQNMRRIDNDVKEWFEAGSYDLETRLLLVAASVFAGALVEEVEDAAHSLLLRIRPAHLATPASAPETPFDPFESGGRRSKRLLSIRARQVERPITGMHYGTASAKVLELTNPAWGRAVLEYVWSEVLALREPLLQWLAEYCASEIARLRMMAADALGALAQQNFVLIESRYIRGWANSYQSHERRTAARIVGRAVWNDPPGPGVELIHHWAGAADNPRLLSTAAYAAAGPAGLRFPASTLADLEKIARSSVNYPSLVDPICQTCLHLLDPRNGSAAQQLQVLQVLQRWSRLCTDEQMSKADAFAVNRVALIAFWVCLWPADDDPIWRQLLQEATAPASSTAAPVMQLILTSLRFRQPAASVRDGVHPRRLAQNGLRALLEQVCRPADTALEPALRSLLASLVQAAEADSVDGDLQRDALRDCADLWDDLPAQAEALRRILL